MGLAALGEARSHENKWLEPLSQVLRVGDGSFEVDPTYTHMGGHNYGDRFSDRLVQSLTDIDPSLTPVGYGEKVEQGGQEVSKYLLDEYIDLAWAAQELLERAAVGLAKRLVEEHHVSNLCLAGGVAMNCKMNGEILRRSGADHVFVQPASNDSGTALGAALHVAQQLGAEIRHPLEHVYYGPEFSNGQIRDALDNCKLSYRSVDDPSAETARILSEGKLVGWFQGAMEFGSRALGGRSILADATRLDSRERVNRDVKYRESWRPFCPSMTDERCDDYLQDVDESSFMIVAYHATETCRSDMPAVVHVDNTVRPQSVKSRTNPRFHALLEENGKRCGQEIVLNTSFNVRGEPIVCTPHEAVRCFYSNGLDALVMGDFVVSKRSQKTN